ncbi:MAG: hypothetical protein Q8N30_06230 [Methylococcales bacterium]|nr:hypothetical protein [Methylococcales bacterium]
MIEERTESKSNFVGYLGIKDCDKVNEGLILPKVRAFFDTRNIKYYKCIDKQASISDLDFKYSNFQYFFPHFYDFIVDEIHKTNDKVETVITYCITLDETNCSKICDKTGIHYDEFLLYKEPVFYFIYIDIKDIFSFLRRNSVLPLDI